MSRLPSIPVSVPVLLAEPVSVVNLFTWLFIDYYKQKVLANLHYPLPFFGLSKLWRVK
jgi:hypothetical protein